MGDLSDHRKVNKLDRCPKCDGALDTGWECTVCGYDARAHVVEDEPRILTGEKLAEAAAEARARGAVGKKDRWT